MRRSTAVVSIALFAVLLPGLPYPAGAQTADMRGSYVLDSLASDNVDRKIEELVKGMWIGGDTARTKLSATNLPAPPRLTIAYTSTEVTITTDADGAIVRPVDGTPSQWTRKDGTTVSVSNLWSAGMLQRTFLTGDGERVNTYALSSDGRTLTMNVVVTSTNRFGPRPLRYKLVYRRAAS